MSVSSWIRVCSWIRASGCSSTPHWTRNDVRDLQRAMSMKISVENGKVYNQMTMGERLERIDEVWFHNDLEYCENYKVNCIIETK